MLYAGGIIQLLVALVSIKMTIGYITLGPVPKVILTLYVLQKNIATSQYTSSSYSFPE